MLSDMALASCCFCLCVRVATKAACLTYSNPLNPDLLRHWCPADSATSQFMPSNDQHLYLVYIASRTRILDAQAMGISAPT